MYYNLNFFLDPIFFHLSTWPYSPERKKCLTFREKYSKLPVYLKVKDLSVASLNNPKNL